MITRPNHALHPTRPLLRGCHSLVPPSFARVLRRDKQTGLLSWAAFTMHLFHSFIILAVILLAGCELAPSRKDIVGTYSGTLNGATETLVLRPDGTFSQDLTLPSGQKTNAIGFWSLEYKAVTLDRYLK